MKFCLFYCLVQTTNEWIAEYSQYQQKYNSSLYLGAKDFAPFAYDAIIAVALMLNQSISDLAKKNKSFENIQYYDKEALTIMKGHMQQLKFNGISVNQPL